MKLYELSKLVRSKNAGAFMVTIDILFETEEILEKVIATGVLNRELIAGLYDTKVEDIKYFECRGARALKFSMPRKQWVGDFGDPDLHACQYHAPLVELEIPV